MALIVSVPWNFDIVVPPGVTVLHQWQQKQTNSNIIFDLSHACKLFTFSVGFNLDVLSMSLLEVL